MNNTVVRLSSRHADLIIRCYPYAEMIYWGKPLRNYQPEMIAALNRPVANSRLDDDVPLTLCPENGRGLFSVPGMEGNRHGLDWSPVFTPQSHSVKNNTLTIVSEDAIAGLRLVSELQLCPNSGVLKTRNTLTNIKSGRYQVDRLAVTLPLPERANEIMAFNGRWIKEFQRHSLRLEHGGYIQENRRGRTSHENFPGMMAGNAGFSEQQGEVWGLHLAWSGNHRLRADCKSDGRRQIQAEVLYFSGEVSLDTGQSISTPWVYATYSASGLNGMSRNFHHYVRQYITPSLADKPRPVHLNTWEGIYFRHDPDYIIRMAEKAAKIGIERFIIDDGWFKGRNSDLSSLGDWYIDAEKYPQGLKTVIEAVKHHGMEFGIWVEPEMINQDSDLYRHHPDWVLKLDNYPMREGRHQLLLDLSNPQVYEYLLERLNWLLSEHSVDYVKWDFNREMVQPAHLGHACQVRQTEQLYRLFDQLNSRFPAVEFESCASGGGRIDYEILKRCHRFWPSDSNDALDRLQIQRGMSYFFPPEVMGAHIGGTPCHTTSRRHSINFRGLTALFGHMGVELDPVSVPQSEQQAFSRYIALHKQLRPVLHTGTQVRIDHPDNTTLINTVIAQDQQQAVVLISQLALPEYALCGNLRIPGLQPDTPYRLEVLDMPDSMRHPRNNTMKRYPDWLKQSVILSGDWLEHVGIALPILDPEAAILLRLAAVN
ncbi:alpha-galactosidase|uniref:Alpha-galactosidase n=1 Tax=Brenneria salicis ATCC 15712 = DSM 30166 TaxID=714314 RepID=A0A366I8N5_9GAMM|nr:alpha-galactosidase [Brenneria salicis]NMN91819.1 alpha-galactosidase [Brenneria salicis ATCC 15712 = DSM 30166]RBP65886.1 alpha-galactosidase [Brenneria salicis ATCC 15712 = DSM 30166]RLM31914.1 alpha-galactosidase [Brenneria salicis ATCC 15712 = DSM 30166]